MVECRRVRSHIKINQTDSIMGIDEGKTTHSHAHIHNNIIKKERQKRRKKKDKEKMVYSTVIKIYAANVWMNEWMWGDREEKKRNRITRTSFVVDKISIRKNRYWNRLLNIILNGNRNFISHCSLLVFVWFEFPFTISFDLTFFLCSTASISTL